MKGGMPKPPAPPPPPAPSSAADNASKAYRDEQRRRAYGFSQTILASGNPPPRNSILGG